MLGAKATSVGSVGWSFHFRLVHVTVPNSRTWSLHLWRISLLFRVENIAPGIGTLRSMHVCMYVRIYICTYTVTHV